MALESDRVAMGLEGAVPPPQTRYARLQGDRTAYQVLGEGPPDLVLTPGSFGHLDIGWDDPGIALFCRTLASFCRLIIFDRRGTGISDPLPLDPLPPWEAYAQELAAVLDEAGSERAALLAELDAGPTAIVRPVLPLIQAPTLVLHRRDARLIPIEHGRYLADHIPGAKLVELSGVDATLFWETPEVALDQIETFLTGVRHTAPPTRILATVLFTDIVDSTGQANRLGDRRWRELLNVHDEVARRVVQEFGGRLIKTTGDGILATFDGPGQAIRCAAALTDELRGIGVQIRAGLHTGEVELRDGDVGGIAVHIAARVMAAAQPGDILASGTVRDLVVGSDITLLDHGMQRLKGVEGTWRLFSATRP
jgi:class 3 adenylate cyclase